VIATDFARIYLVCTYCVSICTSVYTHMLL